MGRIVITEWNQEQLKILVKEPQLCVDATAGTGRDTEFLCLLAGKRGKVIAMDIQEEAIRLTGKRLKEKNLDSRATLILDGHEHIDRYVREESADLIMFNLGYLPGGDHEKATRAETTIAALKKSISLLKKGGVISVMIYSGGDSGFKERDAVLAFLKTLDHRECSVLLHSFYNKPNNPPIPVYIMKV